MNIRQFFTSAVALIAFSNAASAEGLWKPSDFDGAYVHIFDNATNGCWTNIRETRSYAEDQLELAGFNLVERPESKEHEPHPLLINNIVEYRIHVKASRQDNGLCIGYLNSSFWASVAPGYDQSKLILGQIGAPYVWAVWNNKNLNQYMFDQVKDTIEEWVQLGETPILD